MEKLYMSSELLTSQKTETGEDLDEATRIKLRHVLMSVDDSGSFNGGKLDALDNIHDKDNLDTSDNPNDDNSLSCFETLLNQEIILSTVGNEYRAGDLKSAENTFCMHYKDCFGLFENIDGTDTLDCVGHMYDSNKFETVCIRENLDTVLPEDANSMDKARLCNSRLDYSSSDVFCSRCGTKCTRKTSKDKDFSRKSSQHPHYTSREDFHEARHRCQSFQRRLDGYKNYVSLPKRLSSVLNILILLALPTLLHGMANDILRLNIPTEPQLDPSTVCKTYPGLNAPQYHLCFQFPDVTASAIQGVQIAIHECQFQLRNHRWNCSTLEKKNKNPHSSPILRRGYRETAFAYAISAAGVTHQVSKACSMGKLQSCGCDVSVYGKAKDWEWGGCSHNLEFGEKFAEKFMDFKEKAHDIHARINLHNNKVGRMAVIENVRTRCKCHGMSGSCELKTCWKATPDFREIGELLKAKFNMANKQVDLSNEASRGAPAEDDETVFPTTLLYYEKSPNFCHKAPEYDSPGTVGRLCNKTTNGLDNCETLCCGRGYNTLKVRRTERCNCKFHWCCYVICQTCTYNEWVTVCK